MQLETDLQESLSLLRNTNVISDESYKKLLENCFSQLITNAEIHNITTLCSSKPDVIKEVYAALLKLSAEFARRNILPEMASSILVDECNLQPTQAEEFAQSYGKHKSKLQIVLGNIGTHLPHIVDVKWKIDYIVKSSSLDQAEGPMFRLTLLTEAYDEASRGKKLEEINFTCDSRELQDLVYKLKDAVRHCQKISGEK